MIIVIIIKRYSDIERINNITVKKLIVYGRRKVGKTFFIKRVFPNARYFFVKRNQEILDEETGRILSYDAFITLLHDLIKRREMVIIDEFHRLPEDFGDFIHTNPPQGEMILITSTLHLARRYLGTNSPILGYFTGFRMDIIDERDIILNLSNYISSPDTLLEFSVFLREPLLLQFFKQEIDPRRFSTTIVDMSKTIVPALLGEIFQEEDRKFLRIYEGILGAIADGKNRLGEIVNHLYSLKLIKAQSHGLVKPYIDLLGKMGIIEKIKVWNKKFFLYSIPSPLIYTYYYLDEKYGFSEINIGQKNIEEALKSITPILVEDFIRKLLSKIYGLISVKVLEPRYDIDIMLLKFKKPFLVAEVKWRDNMPGREIYETIEKLSKIDVGKKMLVVKNRKTVEKYSTMLDDYNIEIIDAEDIIIRSCS